MSRLEDKIIAGLTDIGYNGPLLEKSQLHAAVDGGPKSIEYTKVVSYLTNEIRTLRSIDEEVNAISAPEDAVAFIMEVSSFLKELNCPYTALTHGHVSDRLQNVSDRLLLLDYFMTELMGARILQEKKPEKKIELKLQETPEAADMRLILQTLRFPKPPPNISIATLFQKLGPTIQIVLQKAGVDLIGPPMFNGQLSDKQWKILDELDKDLNNEYKIRREMLLTRLDCTVQSFQWSDKTKGKEDLIDRIYAGKRKLLHVDPDVDISNLSAARADLAIIEKTSSSSVRKNTQTSLNKVIIGRVPDRGGRTSELAPPPPEMPSWQQRSTGPPGGGRGGRGSGNFNTNRGGGSFNSNRGGGNFNRGDYSSGNQSFSTNYSSGGNYSSLNTGRSSFDSAGSYSMDNKYSSGSYNKGTYDSPNTGSYGGSSYNKGGYDNSSSYSNRSSFDSAGSYGRGQSDGRRDSGGKQDYEQTNKRARTYDSFQSSKTTYSDQYVQENQHNRQYQGRGEDRNPRGSGGRGRSNYQRGGGSSYR